MKERLKRKILEISSARSMDVNRFFVRKDYYSYYREVNMFSSNVYCYGNLSIIVVDYPVHYKY